VTLSDDEAAIYSDPEQPLAGKFPEYKRDMTNAPKHLYNIYLMYNMAEWGLPETDLALFYTVRGDTLIAGSGQSKGHYIPSVYETEYGTLNFSLSHKFGETWTLKFQAKNLLDPDIETVYRSRYIDRDYVKTSYRKGREFSISLSATF
jgi:outer membrane receptor protein involved in Fe transport